LDGKSSCRFYTKQPAFDESIVRDRPVAFSDVRRSAKEKAFDRLANDAEFERRRTVPKVDTYLSFDGTAAQAMRAYEQILGAKLEVLMKFGDAPSGMRGPPGSDDKVMHGQLSFKNGDRLMASDWIVDIPTRV